MSLALAIRRPGRSHRRRRFLLLPSQRIDELYYYYYYRKYTSYLVLLLSLLAHLIHRRDTVSRTAGGMSQPPLRQMEREFGTPARVRERLIGFSIEYHWTCVRRVAGI